MKIIYPIVAWSFMILLSCGKTASWEKVEVSLPYADPTTIKHLYDQSGERSLSARQYSEVGDYSAALDVLYDSVDSSILERYEFDRLDNYRWVDADSLIIAKASTHDLVLFNEDHNLPYARLLLMDLLPDLRALGFEYLALEAMGMIEGGLAYDSLMHERGYPIVYSGIYTREPTFSRLIRKASDLGFTIIGYDQGSGGEREIKGAENIIVQTTTHGIMAKTIVLCGWDHIREGKTHTYWEYALAERLHQKTGIDPLTVASTIFADRGQAAYNHPIVNSLPELKRMVLLDNTTDTCYSEQRRPYYDLEVVHPAINEVSDLQSAKMQCLDLAQLPDSLKTPAMLYIYEKEDKVKTAVPFYRVAITSKQACYPVLYDGQKILLTDGNEAWLRTS